MTENVTEITLEEAIAQRDAANQRLKKEKKKVRDLRREIATPFMPAITWLEMNGHLDMAAILKDAEAAEEGSKIDQEAVRQFALKTLSEYRRSPSLGDDSGWSDPGRYLSRRLERALQVGPIYLGIKASSGHGSVDFDAMLRRILREICEYQPWVGTDKPDYSWKAALSHLKNAIEDLPILSRRELFDDARVLEPENFHN